MGITATDDKPELAKYELGEQIGHGGMATVYRAEDRRLGRDVAVKLIHPHLRGNREVAARFVSEARAVAKLKHRNIVEVYDISDESDAERYLVVELVDGPTLRRLIEQHGCFPPEIAAALGLQLAAALGHAHEQNIVHRDVKPENVLVDIPRGTSRPDSRDKAAHVTVKLTDFGIAKVLDAHGVTSTGQVLGSPAHMAPEQIEGGAVGPRADVFGLGVLLYEAMVGKLPFDGGNPAQVLRKVLDGEHEAAVRARPQVGARWSALLDRALEKDPEQRIGSVAELGEELRAGLALLGFDDTQAELDAYFADPEGYQARHAERVAEALARAGEEARARADVVLASDCFNRALSYRPGDPEILARISAVSRRERMKRVARGAAATLLALAAVGTVWLVWPSQPRAPASEARRPQRRAPETVTAAPSAPTLTTRPALPASAPAPAVSAAIGPPPLKMRRPGSKHHDRNARKDPVQVRVHVQGPRGGQLLIDGAPKSDFFSNPVAELTPGKHRFEFLLKEPECCISPAIERTIEPGEGQRVTLTVTYRDARLQVQGPGGELSCPTLFSGNLRVPGGRAVPMNNLEEREPCAYTPDDSSASRPWSGSVTLRAARTTAISVP